jgi:hypothetical protein
MLLRGVAETIFRTVSGSGTIVSRNSELYKETISKAASAASAQVNVFYFNMAIPGIKLSHGIHYEQLLLSH